MLLQNLGFPDKPLVQVFDDAAQKEVEAISRAMLLEDLQERFNQHWREEFMLARGLAPSIGADTSGFNTLIAITKEELSLDAWGFNAPTPIV